MRRRVIVLAAALAGLVAASSAQAQVIRPPAITGPAQAAMRQLYPPTPLEQVREQAMRQYPPLPLPALPTEQWVPERRVYSPELGREVILPPHYERRISDQQSAVPPLPAFDVQTGTSVGLPGGSRPPVDLRQGP